MSATRPTLSIVIASRNHLNSLKFTLLTLRDQPPSVPHEIIVVDAGSEDDSVQFLANQAEKGTLRLVESPARAGRTAARNVGATAADGRYIAFLDPGMVVGPHWADSLLETLERDPQAGAVGGKVILPDGLIDHAGLALLEMATDKGPRLQGRAIHAGQKGEHPPSLKPLNVQGLAGEGLVVRASAFFAVGGFDEGLGRDFNRPKPMAEAEPAGMDLSLRLGARGWSCIYRHESIMTRLRVSEAEEPGDGMAAVRAAADDQALLTANWLGQARPDFTISADGRVGPAEFGHIRPYILPQLTFPQSTYSARIHPDRSVSADNPAAGVKASVIVLVHDALDYVKRCAASLIGHTAETHEIIFVDNGSGEETAAWLDEFAARTPRITLLRTGKNLGFAGGNNVGLAAATGRHLVLLNSDTVVTEGWLDNLVRTAETHSRAGLIGAVTNDISGLQRLSSVPYDQQSLDGLAEFAARHTAGETGRVDRTLRLTGFCLLIKREVLARIGGLDERFGIGNYEDNDYCLRAHLAGYECLIARDSFVHHFGSRSFAESGIDYVAQIHQQWDIFKRKWNIPAATAYNGPVDLDRILARGYRAVEHFHPLPAADTGIVEGVARTISAEA